jgi:hypothetical protein
MAVLHLVDSSDHLVVSHYSGRITRDEVVSACEGLRRNPDFRPEHRQLADLSQVLSLDLQLEDMKVIRNHDPFSKQARRALFAGLGETLGMARMYETVVAARDLAVFSSLLDALAWLDLDVTVLQVTKAGGRSRTKIRNEASTLTMPSQVDGSLRLSATRDRRGHSSGH